MGLLSLLEQSLCRCLGFAASYVNASNTFPQPLSEREEAMYLDLLDRGDRHARNVLIERNLRLVAHIVKKFDGSVEDPEDLISIGTVGLIKAIGTFNQKKGTRLATYAARCIENDVSGISARRKRFPDRVDLSSGADVYSEQPERFHEFSSWDVIRWARLARFAAPIRFVTDSPAWDAATS
ncbi:MAG: sigma-70 family RNA polymerase sigma factor [Firmicutes bacterium]|nr:sigma-70 family RNA polymerase sigma factor [Bacillota bacterium]